MKINTFDDLYPDRLVTGDTYIGGSSGSNTANGDVSGGGDVVGNPGAYTVVGLRATVSLASNIGGGTVGDVLTITSASPRIAMFATPSNTGAVGSNAMTRTLGGQETVVSHAASGATRTLDLGGGNVFDITLTAATVTLAFSNVPADVAASITLLLRQDATGGRLVTWPASVEWGDAGAPTLSTAAAEVDIIDLLTLDGGTVWFGSWGGSTGSVSPLTTKGDLYTYSSVDARLAVGSNGTGLMADSSQTTGLRWTLRALSGELLMQDGVTAPPVPIETDPSQDDWLYADL